MTYWLAWKTAKAAFIVADSAVTFRWKAVPAVPPPVHRSTFGELSVYDATKRVEVRESDLKITEAGDALYVFAGDAALGQSIGSSFYERVIRRMHPRKAFAEALTGNGPYGAHGHVHAAIAFYDDRGPRILESRTSRGGFVIEAGDLASGGSLPENLHQGLLRLPHMLSRTSLTVEQDLLCGLSVVQSLSVHEYLMEKGVGGLYQGLGVDERGIFQAPSNSYTVSDRTTDLKTESLVAIFPQPGWSIVRVGKGSETKLFTNRVWSEKQLSPDGTATVSFDWKKVDERATSYVALIRTDMRRVILLENMCERVPTLVSWRLRDRRPELTVCEELGDAIVGRPEGQDDTLQFIFARGSATEANVLETLTFELDFDL